MKYLINQYLDDAPMMKNHTYKLIRGGCTSDRLGPCETCGKHVSDVYHQIKYSEYKPGRFAYISGSFGHKDCLMNRRAYGI